MLDEILGNQTDVPIAEHATDTQVDGLRGPEVAFDPGEALVGGDHPGGVRSRVSAGTLVRST